MAGMLHDIGELVLASNFPGQMAEVLTTADSVDTPLAELETAAFRAGHPEIGAYLLALWGLHDAVVEATAFHHRPTVLAERSRADVITAVHVANHLVRDACGATSQAFAPLDRDYLESAGVLPLVDALLAESRQVH